MHSFRVAFTGAQGTGKSTLARALGQALRAAGVARVTEHLGLGQGLVQARHPGDATALASLALGERASAQALRAVQAWHLAREAEADADAAAAPGVQVFDRCLLDSLAYADVLGGLAADEQQALAQAAQASARRLRLLVAMRITGDYPVLSEQDESPGFRRAVEQAILSRAQAWGLPLLPLALSGPEIAPAAQALAACLVPPALPTHAR